MLRTGGLKAVEAFVAPDAWWLTECLECGVHAHYRFEYVLQKNRIEEKTCRACFWWRWGGH
ncbi:hypothetical protein AB0G02_29315, partial [Actinosynnema sp. NPDC023658]|uniref:hypothetical protein n=1 Tax=Actinosynnema sp. NPDC023658 TaxID=3155465 RepID=UPI0033FEA413